MYRVYSSPPIAGRHSVILRGAALAVGERPKKQWFRGEGLERSLFILLNSEKNEPRSAAAVIGPFGLSLRSPSGGCGTRSAQTVLALFPPSPLRLRRLIKAESGIVTVAVFFNPSVLRTPPLYFAAQNTEEEGEMYFPFASAPILYVTPRNAT